MKKKKRKKLKNIYTTIDKHEHFKKWTIDEEKKNDKQIEYKHEIQQKERNDAHAHRILTSSYISLMLSYLMESFCLKTIYQKIPSILGKNSPTPDDVFGF